MGKKSKRKKQKTEEFARAEKQPMDVLGLERICLFVIRWGVYLTLFAPLIILKTSFFPFVTPKTIFFRILVEIIFCSYLILAIAKPRYRPNFKNPLFIAIAGFLLVLVLTSFSGINFARSFWSTYERMTGLFTLFHLLAFFVVLTSCFKQRSDWEKILAAAIFAGVLLSLYVLFSDKLSSRGGGTIGNTSFMAAYLLFDIFFALILVLTKRGGWRVYSGISLVIMTWTLMISTARGAIFAFLGGLVFVILGFMFFSGKKTLRAASAGTLVLLLASTLILAVFQPGPVKGLISRNLWEMSPRLLMWNIAWEGWKERLWLGWGPENFNVVFSKHFDPRLFTSEGGGEIWFDRAHNIIFDMGTSSGVLGLLSYLSVFGVAVLYLLKTCFKVVCRRNLFVPLLAAALLLCYLVQNVLVFDMINSYLMFFLTLAFAGFLITKPRDAVPLREENGADARERRVPIALKSVIVAGFVFLLWFGNVRHLQTAQATAKMMAYGSQIEKSSYFFKETFNSWMLKYEPREQFMQILYKTPAGSEQDEQALKEAFDIGLLMGEKSLEQNPIDFRHYLFLSRVYINSYRFWKNDNDLQRADDLLQKAIALSPANQQGYWQMAEVRFIQGRYQDAAALLETAVELEPSLQQSHWYLAIAYQLAGDYHKAREEVEKSKGYSWQTELTDLKRVIHIYSALEDAEALPALYERAVGLDPADPQLWANLVRSYAKLEQSEKVQETVQKLLRINPDLAPKVQELLGI